MRTKVKPNPAMIRALQESAQRRHSRLHNTDMEQYPAESIVDYYECVHYLLVAFALDKGIKFRSEKAHYELIEYVAHEKIISQAQKILLQELREQRNRILYEGYQSTKLFLQHKKVNIEEIYNKVYNTTTSQQRCK